MIEAVADRLEGAPRQLRRRWSEEFKARAVTEALKPGASVRGGDKLGHGAPHNAGAGGVKTSQWLGWSL